MLHNLGGNLSIYTAAANDSWTMFADRDTCCINERAVHTLCDVKHYLQIGGPHGLIFRIGLRWCMRRARCLTFMRVLLEVEICIVFAGFKLMMRRAVLGPTCQWSNVAVGSRIYASISCMFKTFCTRVPKDAFPLQSPKTVNFAEADCNSKGANA